MTQATAPQGAAGTSPRSSRSTPESAAAPAGRSGRPGWIDIWEPEDHRFWARTGRRVARRNLAVSVFVEHIGFAVWTVWTVVVINLANAGLALSLPQQFWLTAVPNLVGAVLRVPYTFAVPRFGGRLWTAVSAALLLVPCLLLAFVVPSGWLAGRPHPVQFAVLLGCAATAGFGGGNFSSSMANISFFYPEGKKGFPLGVNAAGGNLGVAVAQLAIPVVIVIGVPAAVVARPLHPVHLANAGLVFLPLIAVAVSAAWLRMDSLTQARADTSSYRHALGHPQTWVVSLLYVGTFGSFIGFSFALPLVVKNTFPEFLAQHPFIATYLAGLGFTGALVGSMARPLGGWLADRIGGACVTFCCFIALAAGTTTAIVAVTHHAFPVFLAGFIGVFLFAGMGNGSTYGMIPSIFHELGRRAALRTGSREKVLVDFKRRAAAAIGIAGAVGALGGFLLQVVLRQSSLQVSALVTAAPTVAAKNAAAQAHADWCVPALTVFVMGYLALAALTWFCYLRRRVLVRRVPRLAQASV